MQELRGTVPPRPWNAGSTGARLDVGKWAPQVVVVTTRLAGGRLSAPLQDDVDHTGHQPNEVLFAVIRHGLRPLRAAPGKQSDLPASAASMRNNEIWSAMALTRSRWSSRARATRAKFERRAASLRGAC